MPTTTDDALGVYELLEDIPLCLPLRDLLFAQRVSKSWHALIQHSDRIQTALCFSPIDRSCLSLSEDGKYRVLDYDRRGWTYPRPMLNPSFHCLLRARIPDDAPCYKFASETRCEGLIVPTRPMLGHAPWKGFSTELIKALRRPEASSPTMPLVQPPIRVLTITGQATVDEGSWACPGCLEDGDEDSGFKAYDAMGLTISGLLDVLEDRQHVCDGRKVKEGFEFWAIKEIGMTEEMWYVRCKGGWGVSGWWPTDIIGHMAADRIFAENYPGTELGMWRAEEVLFEGWDYEWM